MGGTLARIEEVVVIGALGRKLVLLLPCAILVSCDFGATDRMTAPDVTGNPEGARIGGG
jgi:hypothetical protein